MSSNKHHNNNANFKQALAAFTVAKRANNWVDMINLANENHGLTKNLTVELEAAMVAEVDAAIRASELPQQGPPRRVTCLRRLGNAACRGPQIHELCLTALQSEAFKDELSARMWLGVTADLMRNQSGRDAFMQVKEMGDVYSLIVRVTSKYVATSKNQTNQGLMAMADFMDQDPKSAEILGQAGACDVVLEALKQFGMRAELVAGPGMLALAALGSSPANHHTLRDKNACDTVWKLFQKWTANGKIADETTVCNAMTALGKMCDYEAKWMHDNKVCKMVAPIIVQWPNHSIKFVQEACFMLRCFSVHLHEDIVRNQLLTRCLVVMLEDFGDESSSVMDSAARCLAVLATHHTSKLMQDKVLFDRLCILVTKFILRVTYQQYSGSSFDIAALLTALCRSGGDEVKDKFKKIAAFSSLVKAVARLQHPSLLKDAGQQQLLGSCVAALADLADDIGVAHEFEEAGASGIILNMVQRIADRPSSFSASLFGDTCLAAGLLGPLFAVSGKFEQAKLPKTIVKIVSERGLGEANVYGSGVMRCLLICAVTFESTDWIQTTNTCELIVAIMRQALHDSHRIAFEGCLALVNLAHSNPKAAVQLATVCGAIETIVLAHDRWGLESEDVNKMGVLALKTLYPYAPQLNPRLRLEVDCLLKQELDSTKPGEFENARAYFKNVGGHV